MNSRNMAKLLAALRHSKIVDRLEMETGLSYGVRVFDEGYDGYNEDAGYDLHNSRVWIDGEETDEWLLGTCAISINCDGKNVGHYCGDRVALISGARVGYGEDEGEIILADARIVRWLSTENDFVATGSISESYYRDLSFNFN